MRDRGQSPTQIQKRVVGQRITVGERTIQPVAQVAGWFGSGGSDTAGAWLRVTPIEVVVREEDGPEYRVGMTDPTRESMRGIIFSALLVASVCWLFMFMLRRKRA
jgi:hypothetical protein